jgi:hypothetical protein
VNDLEGLMDGGGLDPVYEAMLASMDSVEEADHQESDTFVPAGKYLFKVQTAVGRKQQFDPKKPGVWALKLGIKVVRGKQAEGRMAFVDLPLEPSKEVWEGEKGNKTPRLATPEEYQGNVAKFAQVQKRVARVLHLQTILPMGGLSQSSIDSWAKAAIGVEFIADLRAKQGKSGATFNQIYGATFAAPDELLFADKEKKKAKGTALEVLEKILKGAPASGNGKASSALD